MRNPLKSLMPARRDAISTTLTELDALREAVASAQAEIDQIQRAPLSQVEAEQALDHWLDQVSTDAVDSLRPGPRLVSRDYAARDPVLYHHIQRQGDVITIDPRTADQTLLGLIVAACRPAIRQVFADQIADTLAARPGLSGPEREARLAQARADLLLLETEEEQSIRQLEDAGVAVQRRDNAPAALWLATDASLERLAH